MQVAGQRRRVAGVWHGPLPSQSILPKQQHVIGVRGIGAPRALLDWASPTCAKNPTKPILKQRKGEEGKSSLEDACERATASRSAGKSHPGKRRKPEPWEVHQHHGQLCPLRTHGVDRESCTQGQQCCLLCHTGRNRLVGGRPWIDVAVWGARRQGPVPCAAARRSCSPGAREHGGSVIRTRECAAGRR